MKKLLLIVLTALAVSGFYSCSKAESTADDEVLEDTLDFEEYYSTLKASNDEMAIKLKEKEAKALEMQEALVLMTQNWVITKRFLILTSCMKTMVLVCIFTKIIAVIL